MVEKCYKSANKILGPCGPCAFINLIGLKGSPKLEKELQEIGRLKPFHASNFTSFLIWAKKYNVDLKIFLESTKIPDKLFKLMFKYEKTPKEKQKEMKEECLKRQNRIFKRNKNKIFILKKDPLKKINELLSEGYSVAFTMAHYRNERGWSAGHLRVVYKKEGDTYFIKDSKEGLIKLSKKQIQKEIKYAKKIGLKSNIIAYKPKSLNLNILDS